MIDEELKQKVLKEMRNPEIYLKGVLDYVEKRIKYVFGVACEDKLSINEWQPDTAFVGQLNQKTALITARLFDLWENAIIEELDKRLSKFNVKIEHYHNPNGDMIIIFPDGEKMIWEIKTSQAKDSWTGATHSSSKSSNYILINFSVNKNQSLEFGDNPSLITGLAVFVWDGMEAEWQGKPTEKNSFTSLKVSSEIAKQRPEIVVVGLLEHKKKWCKIIRKKL
ncbi:hypothetical protein KAT24_00715 [Candidatus Pacearchaeota archaeon]|nr:hypothetical protein [Candidatus Pacearchaeota archaeon]